MLWWVSKKNSATEKWHFFSFFGGAVGNLPVSMAPKEYWLLQEVPRYNSSLAATSSGPACSSSLKSPRVTISEFSLDEGRGMGRFLVAVLLTWTWCIELKLWEKKQQERFWKKSRGFNLPSHLFIRCVIKLLFHSFNQWICNTLFYRLSWNLDHKSKSIHEHY